MSKFDLFSPHPPPVANRNPIAESCFCGQEVGHDVFGNRYYRELKTPQGVREKRWVMYVGEPEASKVPPEWHIWLHHTADAPIPDSARQSWQKPHIENMTGTPDAWLPPASWKVRSSQGRREIIKHGNQNK